MILGNRSLQIVQKWDDWQEENARIVAPRLLYFEVTNVVHRRYLQGALTASKADEAIDIAIGLPIEIVDAVSLHHRSLEISRRFNRPAAYDAHYLALSELVDAEFWTMDKRLYNSVQHHLPWVKLLD